MWVSSWARKGLSDPTIVESEFDEFRNFHKIGRSLHGHYSIGYVLTVQKTYYLAVFHISFNDYC